MSKIVVATTQFACSWELERNLDTAESLVREAAARGANLVLLQELFAEDPELAQRRLVHVPMGRFAEAEEIAAAAAFLASDDSSFMTASEFLVDGGISSAYVTPLDQQL